MVLDVASAVSQLDSKKLLFKGFVDNETEGLKLSEQKEELEDHALVFILLPYRYSWIQPKGACNWELLAELIAAITVFHLNDLIVKSLVWEGAQSDIAFMKKCGYVGKHEQIVSTFFYRKTLIVVEISPANVVMNTCEMKEPIQSTSAHCLRTKQKAVI